MFCQILDILSVDFQLGRFTACKHGLTCSGLTSCFWLSSCRVSPALPPIHFRSVSFPFSQLDVGCVCERKCLSFSTGWEDAKNTEPNCLDSLFSLEDTWSQLNFYFVHDPGFGKPKQVCVRLHLRSKVSTRSGEGLQPRRRRAPHRSDQHLRILSIVRNPIFRFLACFGQNPEKCGLSLELSRMLVAHLAAARPFFVLSLSILVLTF